VGYLVSYQYQPTLFGLELAVDILPDRVGENTYSPHAMVFVGRNFGRNSRRGLDEPRGIRNDNSTTKNKNLTPGPSCGMFFLEREKGK